MRVVEGIAAVFGFDKLKLIMNFLAGNWVTTTRDGKHASGAS